jgi:hypothetical protein
VSEDRNLTYTHGGKNERSGSPSTAKAKLAGLWVDRAENLNGNYAISDKPLSEQEWVEKHVKH